MKKVHRIEKKVHRTFENSSLYVKNGHRVFINV